ncbi:hypothetical protein NE237_017243 [Protea cynaroides]|uniref:Uncharacterized protein n=1 Tax=Protea cynaroides TaxID=273540 RepID=A0A9Q0K7N1_9MAGN|nr:hypothetical protein NE237_017243 [Protea cynaroides]
MSRTRLSMSVVLAVSTARMAALSSYAAPSFVRFLYYTVHP